MRMDVIPFQGARQGRCAQQIQATKITEDTLWAKPSQGLRLLTMLVVTKGTEARASMVAS